MNNNIKKRSNYIGWNDTFMIMAQVIAQRSKDPSTQVGCCIVDSNNYLVAMGYNGLPRGCPDDEFPWEKEGELHLTKYAYVIHAEQNAILNSNTHSLKGMTMYVTRHPCNECAKLIIQSGITHVYYYSDPYPDNSAYIAAKRMFESSGIKTQHYIPDKIFSILDNTASEAFKASPTLPG